VLAGHMFSLPGAISQFTRLLVHIVEMLCDGKRVYTA
jgi:hypothetical protein